MKKFITILVLGLLWCNPSFAITLSKCFAFGADEWSRDIITSEFEHEIFETRKFNIDTNRGTITRYWRTNESVHKKRLKDPDWGPDTLRSYTKVYKLIYVDENSAKGKSIIKDEDSITIEEIDLDLNSLTARENTDSKRMTSWGQLHRSNSWIHWQCEKGKDSGSSGLLDYWWALILIIAVTFFIYTQSGDRLKKIRKK